MASTNLTDDAIVGINVTPLVDITLVLLIIFMVTAKFHLARACRSICPGQLRGRSAPPSPSPSTQTRRWSPTVGR